jgi:flagellar basal-body rod protein FlgF
MENALLVGLSRQMSLSHELDVVANNIANIDTTGFKADKAAFSEFLMPHAADQQFPGSDRRVSFVQDRATWIDFSPGEGYQVLGDGGPITFQPTDHDISISPNGIITVREGSSTADSQRGKLQIAGFDQPQLLQKDSSSTFMAPNGVNAGPTPPGTRVMQGAIEKSNVNAVAEMARMIQITRSYSDIAAILQQQGDQRRNALQQLSQQPNS